MGVEEDGGFIVDLFRKCNVGLSEFAESPIYSNIDFMQFFLIA